MGAWRCTVSIVVSFVNSHVFCISRRRNWPRSAHPLGLLLHLKMSFCSLFLKLKKGKSEFLRLSAARSETLSAQPDVLEFYGAHAGPAEVPAQPLSEVALAGAPTVREQSATFPHPRHKSKHIAFLMAQHWIRIRRVGSAGSIPVVYGVACVRPGGRWCAFVNRGNISHLSVTDRGEILLDFVSSCRVLSWRRACARAGHRACGHQVSKLGARPPQSATWASSRRGGTPGMLRSHARWTRMALWA